MSSFSLFEALRHLIAARLPGLILFGSCKHFESEFNPEGPKKMNSPHLIPHPELMKRGTLGFFPPPPPAYDSALWDLQKGQTAKQHVVGIVELAVSRRYWSSSVSSRRADVVHMNVKFNGGSFFLFPF